MEKQHYVRHRVRTPEQQEKHRIDQRARDLNSTRVYFADEAESAHFRFLARKSGYPQFSKWIVQMLHNAAGGSLYPPEYVEGLKAEGERLRRWLDASREEADDYKQQVRRLQSQRDSLLLLIHGLPSGAEVAARFLQQHAEVPA